MPDENRRLGWRLSERAKRIGAQQRHHFNDLVDVFDVPQPNDVVERLRKIIDAAELQPGEVVLDVGTGAGVLIPLFERYYPSQVLACDVAERMLERVRQKYPQVRAYHCDFAVLPLGAGSVDAIFMNAVYGNVADKPAACRNAARILRGGGRLIISHPLGKDFVERLRKSGDVFIESLPTRRSFKRLLEPLGFRIKTFVDEPRLYLMVAHLDRSSRRRAGMGSAHDL